MRRFLAVSTILALALVGCGGPTIAGEYDMSGGKMPAGGSAKMTFADSKVNVAIAIPLPTGGNPIKMDMSGTYTVNGDKLDMDITTAKLDESSVPAALKPMIAANKGQMDAMKFKTTGTFKIEGDVVTYTAKDDKGADASMTLTKVKK